MLALDFDYVALPAVHTCGGTNVWDVSCPALGSNSLTVKVAACNQPTQQWWLTTVYGPQEDIDKVAFLQELRALRGTLTGPWVLTADKNNGRLSRRMMGRFRRFLNDLELLELHLHGRLFTWSNERTHPTLERIDRMSVSPYWELLFPRSSLHALSTRCSDHAPLLLQFEDGFHPKRRFRFEAFWSKFDGFLETVEFAWNGPRPGVDPLQTIDHLLQGA